MPIREYLVAGALRKGVNPGRIRVIPHGVALEDVSFSKEENLCESFGIPSGRKVLSFVGRLVKQNYVYDLIALAGRLSKIRDDFILLMVGDGSERENVKTLVQEYRLCSVVRLTGFQPREKVMAIRRQSFLTLCLMGGFSLIEACAARCPVISYDVEWHYELVKNRETGFLIAENDLDGLTEAVVYLLDHPEEAEEMGARAQELAFSRHDILKTSEVKKNCYRELLDGKFRKCKVLREPEGGRPSF
jgi:glycosyltransferase involved in cell wall biosynthesis